MTGAARAETRRAAARPDGVRDIRGAVEAAAEGVARAAPPGPQEPQLSQMVRALRLSGLLGLCAPAPAGAGLAHHPADPLLLMEALSAVGGADLSAGRIFEGHVNALKLVDLHAEAQPRNALLEQAGNGALFAIWGAEGQRPVRLKGRRLEGEKLYASGADLVDVALVTARDEEGRTRLISLSADRLQGRLFPDEWSTTGMRATASGRCDLHGVSLDEDELLGPPDVYEREPHFRGGVWRYAAVWLGAMREMTRATAAQLERRGQEAAPLQCMRLRRMAMACETARLWLGNAASSVESAAATPADAASAILARLAVADAAGELLSAMDDALGAASFAASHPVERRRRDLMVYMRQAAPDAMGDSAMETISGDASLARRWFVA